MTHGRKPRWIGGTLALTASLVSTVHADVPTPPWSDGVPLAPWARSVEPGPDDRGGPGDLVVFAGPSRASGRRGVTRAGARLPLFGAKRGSGCDRSWWLVGPLAWVCSDHAVLSAEEPAFPGTPLSAYFFLNAHGASAYASLEAAREGESDRELEGGWAVAVVEQRSTPEGERFARTSKNLWIALRDLAPARPSSFEGVVVPDGLLHFAWVVADRARVWSSPPGPRSKTVATRNRLDRVPVEDRSGESVRVGPSEWMAAADLAQPSVSGPPEELSRSDERWIDVDLGTQTLVAYAGARPVYATLVSTGRGPAGSDSATPVGVHRIWVKLRSSDMDNVERDALEAHYSLEDVPNVQFFDHAVGLHGAYWHAEFGRVKSHGCVNLAPRDASWLFDFTEPRLPDGWAAVFPTDFDPGTLVRVR